MKNVYEADKNFDVYSKLLDNHRFADAYYFLNFTLLDYQKDDLLELIHLISESIKESVIKDKKND